MQTHVTFRIHPVCCLGLYVQNAAKTVFAFAFYKWHAQHFVFFQLQFLIEICNRVVYINVISSYTSNALYRIYVVYSGFGVSYPQGERVPLLGNHNISSMS